MGSRAFACEVCDGLADWRLCRIGDVVTTWACDDHFGRIARRLQRDARTELVVTVNTVNVLSPEPDFTNPAPSREDG